MMDSVYGKRGARETSVGIESRAFSFFCAGVDVRERKLKNAQVIGPPRRFFLPRQSVDLLLSLHSAGVSCKCCLGP